MKKLHLTFVAFCCALLGVAQSSGNITFSVDMSNYTSAYTEVSVSGDFNAWTSTPMINIGGGIWETTVSIPGGDHEYLYTIDNWIDQEILDPASSCTITNEFGYVHRFYTVDGDASIPTVCWNSCDACAVDSGCTDSEAENFNPEATVDDGSCLYQVSVGLHTPFQFEIDLPIEVHFFPLDTTSVTSGDYVFEMDIAYADESLWQTTALLPSGTWSFLFSIEGGLMEDPMNFEDSCYEEGGRSFELGEEGPVDLSYWCWETCNSNCSPIGCTDPTASNYFYAAQEDDGSCLYAITFAVDMSSYADTVNFDDVQLRVFPWEVSGDVFFDMAIDTANVWVTTVELPLGEFYYEYTHDAALGSESDNWQGGWECFCAAMWGRELIVEGTQDLGVVCWGSCSPCLVIAGCMDPMACNFNPEATYDDTSCEYTCYGCTSEDACNYDPGALFDDGSCIASVCTDPMACNYNPEGGACEGGCQYPGCTDATACNYDPDTECPDPSVCQYAYVCDLCGTTEVYSQSFVQGESTDDWQEFNAPAQLNGHFVTFEVELSAFCMPQHIYFDFYHFGATSSELIYADASESYETYEAYHFGDGFGFILENFDTEPDNCQNYINTFQVRLSIPADGEIGVGIWSSINAEYASGDISVRVIDCEPIEPGCTNPLGLNYNPQANYNDGTCEFIEGCTNEQACNYDPEAYIEDYSCVFGGCTDPLACNYDESAPCDDNSCAYTGIIEAYPDLCVQPAGCDIHLPGNYYCVQDYPNTYAYYDGPLFAELDRDACYGPIGVLGSAEWNCEDTYFDFCNVDAWFEVASQWQVQELELLGDEYPFVGTMLPTQPVDRFFDIVPQGCGQFVAVFNPPSVWAFESVASPAFGTIQVGDSLGLTSDMVTVHTEWVNGPLSPVIVEYWFTYEFTFEFYSGCDAQDETLHTKTASFQWSEVDFSDLQVQAICGVSVNGDDHNEISWLDQPSALGYNLYESTSSDGSLEAQTFLGTVPPGTQLFVDENSSGSARSYRYLLEAVDACGFGSAQVDNWAHTSLHLAASQSVAGGVNLLWNEYQGLQYDAYQVYRSTDGGVDELIAEIPALFTAYTDNAPPAGENTYRVAFTADSECAISPGLLTGGQTISSNAVSLSLASFCGPGTVWDPSVQQCIVADAPTGCSALDFNQSGDIDTPDLLTILGAYGSVCD